MSKIVTLRLADDLFRRFRILAERENRPLSNFIETAARRHVEEESFADEFEMREIMANRSLRASLARGHADARARRGRFA